MMARRNTEKNTNNIRQPQPFVAVGRVGKPHGIRGALLVASISEVIHSLRPGQKIFLGKNQSAYTIQNFSAHRNRYILILEEITDRDSASQLRGSEVLISVEDADPLPDGTYYYWQLLGLHVQTIDNQDLGTLERIIETGANDVYLVRSAQDKEILIPAIKSVIETIDFEQKLMIVKLLPGLLE
jgi:16S rRNA processing protein RimM